jgi:hypothetical protein
MNNTHIMSASFEARKNQQAIMITAGFAGLLILLLFLVKWELPVFEKPVQDTLVEINLPDEPEPVIKMRGGGGGGGNPVQAVGIAGTASSQPSPGKADEDAKDVETDDNAKNTATILKPDKPKPTATKINNNSAVVKVKPKVIIEATPAPAKPKAVLGRTLMGNNTGGGVADNYDRSGGAGKGNGVGKGDGDAGGGPSGSGGGNGPGRGPGTGPRVTRGDRRIVASYSFQGDLEKATIYADIKVSENGSGQFVQFSKGSSTTSQAYKVAIMQYLRNIKFNTADHESTVTVQFNFRIT